MRALDLFCGSGGASMGLFKAGFRVYGVDIIDRIEYPFHSTFYRSDVFNCNMSFEDFDFIWASPPCQRYSIGGNKNSRLKYPDYIGKVRNMLLEIGKPFVIENVVGAPLRQDLMLCGEMFNLKVIRHRIFEIHGFECKQPHHPKHRGTVSSGEYQGVYTGGRCGCFGNNEKRKKLKVGSIGDWQNAMGINWITNRKMLAESIPPAYSKYIANQFLHSKAKEA